MSAITVFTTEDCGRCPQVVERAREVAADHDVDVDVVDVEENRQQALKYGVFSVPTTVVADETTLQGVPSTEDIAAALDD